MTAAPGRRIPAIVLGGTGYVAGELLRLLALHPALELAGVVSDSSPGSPVAAAFPHLAPAYPRTAFVDLGRATELAGGWDRGAVFCAAPHGAAAAMVGGLLAATGDSDVRIVDISADHRFRKPQAYEAVYASPAPPAAQLDAFSCALPEHGAAVRTRHVAHPGCFASAMLLALVPLIENEVIEPDVYISGVTGSTGSGRTPSPGTHHPDRHGDLYAYKPLDHRHAPEVEAVCRAVTGRDARVNFVAHSGPFARGIHVTLQARLARPLASQEVLAIYERAYAHAPFVRVLADAPHVKHVVASNHAALCAATRAGTLVAICVLDNLTKGAAGGAVQWMNRLHGLPERAGLDACAAGWT